jgi:hypothetical protein
MAGRGKQSKVAGKVSKAPRPGKMSPGGHSGNANC